MLPHQCPSLMNTQMMFLTWHLGLAFQGVNYITRLLVHVVSNNCLVLMFEVCRFKYRKTKDDSSHGAPLSRPTSFNKEKQEGKKPPSRVTSFKNSTDEFNPFKVIVSS
jgi:hypothetical protein